MDLHCLCDDHHGIGSISPTSQKKDQTGRRFAIAV